MKSGVRILALATAPIQHRRTTLLIGIVGRDGIVEGVLSSRVSVDGTDATSKIIRMLRNTRFGEQIRVIATNGIALAGLNLIDTVKLENHTGTKFLSLTRTKPHPAKLAAALKHHSKIKGVGVEERMILLDRFRKMDQNRSSGFYVQSSLDDVGVRNIITSAVKLLRLAHIIARGVSTGESKGRI
jgi:endonuclease V-like protein UPF0215 family